MAKILVRSTEGWPSLTIKVDQNDEGWTSGKCPACAETISDRGQFEDTVEAISRHVDGKCPTIQAMGLW